MTEERVLLVAERRHRDGVLCARKSFFQKTLEGAGGRNWANSGRVRGRFGQGGMGGLGGEETVGWGRGLTGYGGGSGVLVAAGSRLRTPGWRGEDGLGCGIPRVVRHGSFDRLRTGSSGTSGRLTTNG